MSENPARERIVVAAARLLREGGAAAVTTRAVAEAAGVQAPAIYRLFGDKDGLIDAVAEGEIAHYVALKAAVVESAEAEGIDPLVDLREGWLAQVAFGLANPDLFRLLADPHRAATSPAVAAGQAVFEARVRRVAATGRLRVDERRAQTMIQSAGLGVITALLATPPAERDPDLPDLMYEAVMARVLLDGPGMTGRPGPAEPGLVPHAVALRALAPGLEALSSAERSLLGDWLDRVIAAAGLERS